LRERIPALDGIRGIAILSVVVYHVALQFPPSIVWPASWIYAILAWNGVGVDAFFVLSGFLITGILLDARGARGYFSAFYARRVLRIVPVYYLFLIWLLVIRRTPIPSGTGIYYWTFTTNVMIAQGKSVIPETGPLWSLSVEEQFYLFWPAIIALVPPRHFRALCWALIAISLSTAIACTLAGNGTHYVIMRLDELAGGGLVASFLRDGTPIAPPKWLWLAVAALLVFAMKYENQMWILVGTRSAGLLTALTIPIVARDSSTTLSKVLSWRPLISWGLYSYAIYVIHMSIAIPACLWLRTHWPPSFPKGLPLTLSGIALVLALCWIAGWISYRVIERPILSLKRFVPMPKREPTMMAAAI